MFYSSKQIQLLWVVQLVGVVRSFRRISREKALEPFPYSFVSVLAKQGLFTTNDSSLFTNRSLVMMFKLWGSSISSCSVQGLQQRLRFSFQWLAVDLKSCWNLAPRSLIDAAERVHYISGLKASCWTLFANWCASAVVFILHLTCSILDVMRDWYPVSWSARTYINYSDRMRVSSLLVNSDFNIPHGLTSKITSPFR